MLLLLLNSFPQPDLVLQPDFLQPMQRPQDPLQQQDLHSSNLKTQESSEQHSMAYKEKKGRAFRLNLGTVQRNIMKNCMQ